MDVKCTNTLTGHKGRVWCCAWQPGGKLLASCGQDKTIRVWGPQEAAWHSRFVLTEAHTRTARSLAWSPCGHYLACASFDGTVSVWDDRTSGGGAFVCGASLEGHENEVKSVGWSASGEYLATCSRDKSVWVWDVDKEEDEYMCASVLHSHTQDVKRVRWHPEVDMLATASYDNTVRLFQPDSDDDWESVATLAGHGSTVWSVAWDATGTRLASCSEDTSVKIWQSFPPGNPEGIPTVDNHSAWRCSATLGGYSSRPVYDLDWSHANGLIVTAGGDDAIRIFREAAGGGGDGQWECAASVRDAHQMDVNSVSWNPVESGTFASASDDGTVKLWRVKADELC